MNDQTQPAQMTPQQRQAIAKAKARLRLQQQGQPAPPANGSGLGPVNPMVAEGRAMAAAAQARPMARAPAGPSLRSETDAIIEEAAANIPGGYDAFNRKPADPQRMAAMGYVPDPLAKSGYAKPRAPEAPTVNTAPNSNYLTDVVRGIEAPIVGLTGGGLEGWAKTTAQDPVLGATQAVEFFSPVDDAARAYQGVKQAGAGLIEGDMGKAAAGAQQAAIEGSYTAMQALPGSMTLKGLTAPSRAAPTTMAGAQRAAAQATQAPAVRVSNARSGTPVVAPTVPQRAPRAAQAGPAGAGQQAGAGAGAAQPVLNAVPVAPAANRQQALVARDTAKILTRIMRAANLKNADIRGYLPGAVQRYKSLNDSRVPFAFFLESDLPKNFAEPVAADIVTKLQGWGRARNAAMGKGDTSAQITQGTIKELRGSQQDFLTQSAEANLYKGSLISQEDQILKSLRETGKKGYEPVLAYARDAMEGRRVPNAAERAGFEELRGVLGRPVFRDRIPNDVRMTAEAEGLDILELIERDPVTAAHWLQSNLNKLEDAAEINGRATPASLAYGKMRADVLEPLKKAAPGYEGALNRYGHEWGAKNAVRFGKGLFTEARSAYDTGQKVRAFKRLGRRQQTVAWKSIRDEFLNEFRGTAEDAAAKITRMQQEGALDLLEQLGARGKRFADDIRRIAQQENPSIRAIEQASNSLTFKNLSGAEAAREMVQSPINQAVGSVTDKTSWPMTIAADAVVMGTTGLPVPLMTAAKALDRFGNPSPKTLSRATEGLYGLPPKVTGGEALPAVRAPRTGGGKPKPPPAPVQQELGDLLKALDEVEKDPKRRGGPEGKRLMDQIEAVRTGQATAPAKPRRVKGAAPAAPTTTAKTKPPLPGQTSNSPPMIGGAFLGALTSGGATYAATGDEDLALKAGLLGGIGGGVVGSRFGKGSTPKAPPAVKPKPAFDQRFMKEAQRLVSYNGGVDKAIDAQQYVIDQLKNSKAPNAQDRLNRAVSIQYAIRRMAERSNRELDQIVPMRDAPATGPKPIDPNTNYNIDPRGDKFIIRTDAGEEVLGAPQFTDRKQALAWLQGETRKARQGGATPKPRPGPPGVKPPPVKNGLRGNAEAIGAGTGAVFAPDADGDGEISFGERAGAAITGGVLGNIARRASGTGAPKVKPPMRGADQAGLGGRPKPPAPRNAPPKGPPKKPAPPKKAEEVALINALKKARANETASRRRNVMRDNRDELNRPAEEAVIKAEQDLLEYRDRQFRQAANTARWMDRGAAAANVGKKAAVATGNQIKKTMMKNDAELLKMYGFAVGGIGATALGMRALAGPDGDDDKKNEVLPPTDKRYFVETKLKKRPEMLGPVQNALVELGMLDIIDADTKWGTKTKDALAAYLSRKSDRLPDLPLQDYEVPALLAEAYGGYQENGKWFYNTGEPIVYPPKQNDTYLPARPLRPDEARRMAYEKRTEAERKK